MKYIYLYKFRGNEATFSVEAETIAEADERVEAMKTAQFEGTWIADIPVDDGEMKRIMAGTVH